MAHYTLIARVNAADGKFPFVNGGTCIACFRPALVNNVRKGSSISITFENALAVPEIREIK
jgi:hypothetical protein